MLVGLNGQPLGGGAAAAPSTFNFGYTSKYVEPAPEMRWGDTHTASNVSIGPAPGTGERRYVIASVVAINSNNDDQTNPATTTIEFDFAATNRILDAHPPYLDTTGNFENIAFFVWLEKPTGTTMDVRITVEGVGAYGWAGLAIHIWTLIVDDTWDMSIYHTAKDENGYVPMSIALDAPATPAGVAAIVGDRNGSGTGTIGGTMGFSTAHTVDDFNGTAEYAYAIGGPVTGPFTGQTITFDDGIIVDYGNILTGITVTAVQP